jgi:hypothetical protein
MTCPRKRVRLLCYSYADLLVRPTLLIAVTAPSRATVRLAARVCARAEPGEILIPAGVRHLVAGKGFLFSGQGEVVLRGFEDSVRLYDVGGIANP